MARIDPLGPVPGGLPLRLTPATFPPSPVLIPDVRRWFGEFAAPHLPGSALEVATLLLSELVTNAVRHAGTTFTVSAALAETSLQVEVEDLDPQLPAVVAPDPEEVTGRGMMLVDRLASRWGAEPTNAGKRVWFELDLPE